MLLSVEVPKVFWLKFVIVPYMVHKCSSTKLDKSRGNLIKKFLQP